MKKSILFYIAMLFFTALFFQNCGGGFSTNQDIGFKSSSSDVSNQDDNSSSDDSPSNDNNTPMQDDSSSPDDNNNDNNDNGNVFGDSEGVSNMLKTSFDFVEEFDGLQDWEQAHRCGGDRCGNIYSDTRPQYFPKLLDGSASRWGYYSNWSRETGASQLWIGGSDGREVWRGSKSLSIDLGGTAGPSRFGLHLTKGYKDISLFYMLNIPKNMFPTSCSDGRCSGGGPEGYYEEGKPYAYFAAWKFNTFNMNCGGPECSTRGYGAHYAVPGFNKYNYGPAPGLVIGNSNKGTEHTKATDNGTNLDGYMGKWWGVEFRLRNINNDTKYVMDIWVYDQDGNSQHVMRGHEYSIDSAAHGGVWDHFFFGGNNSNSWTWGDTMQSHYHIDDFIVDDGSKGQIGPRYFSIIKN